MSKWLTCTPKSFDGGPSFFARDSGLLCRGFQKLGISCSALMPFGVESDDLEDLIRTDYKNLESVDWWKSHEKLVGVVLYSWASPSYRRVAAAIHEAGLFLVVNLDNSGLISPLVNLKKWTAEQWILSGQGIGMSSWFCFLKLVARGLTLGLIYTDPLRAYHLKQADIIACVSPTAASRIKHLCSIYGGERMARKVRLIPHAVEAQFNYTGETKLKRVVCVGRWDDFLQKRTPLLCETVSKLITNEADVSVVIIGSKTDYLLHWHGLLEDSQRARVSLAGELSRMEIALLMKESQIFYSPSAFESFGIAAAEALCCGCSVVAEHAASMAAFDWFISEGSGSLSDGSSADQQMTALQAELNLWDEKKRDAFKISQIWSVRLHEYHVAAEVLALFQEARE